ncbi:MAG: hypothetical protein AAF657_09280 [Acidobacteriota bacterium]
MTEPKDKRLGGFDKLLIGCGLGCAALILIGVLGFTFATMWLVTPGKQSATEFVADQESVGAVRLHSLAADPGAQALITRVLERLQEANREQQREQLPPSLGWISDMQAQQADPSGFNMFFPKDMTVAFEAAGSGEGASSGQEVHYVAAFNPRVMVRMFKTMFGFIGRADNNEQMRSTHRGHPIYRLEDDVILAFVGSTVMVSDAEQVMERAIDRFETGQVAGAEPGGRFDFAITPAGDWDIEGALSNEAGLAAGFLEGITRPGPASLDFEGDVALPETERLHLGFGFDIVSADELAGQTVLECGDRQAAARWLEALERRYEDLRAEAEDRGLDYEITARVEGSRVLTELRLNGIEELLLDALTFAEE